LTTCYGFFSRVSSEVPENELQAIGEHPNSNVLNILPVTTFRTIDLEGKKNFDPLFSRFCVNLSVFFSRKLCTKTGAVAVHASGCEASLTLVAAASE
jgi:hypothetical protein